MLAKPGKLNQTMDLWMDPSCKLLQPALPMPTSLSFSAKILKLGVSLVWLGLEQSVDPVAGIVTKLPSMRKEELLLLLLRLLLMKWVITLACSMTLMLNMVEIAVPAMDKDS